MFIPAGFGTVAPYFSVRNAPAFVDFLVGGLGGVRVGTHLRPDGSVANAQVRWGDTTVMVGESREAADLSAIALILYVENADAAVAQAVAHGAMAIMDVSDQPYGDRQGGVADKWGMTWWLSQRLTAAAYMFE